MKAIVRLPAFLIAWLLFMALKLVVAITGLFFVLLLWPRRMVLYDDLPQWLRPWANPEDHHGGTQYKKGRSHNSLPDWWIQKKGVNLGSFYRYHAIRNPANGLRSYEFLDLDPIPDLIRYVAKPYLRYYEPVDMRGLNIRVAGYLCWQNWYQAGCKLVIVWNKERHLVLKLGWRIEPRDAHEPMDEFGTRINDTGFASKLLVYRKG